MSNYETAISSRKASPFHEKDIFRSAKGGRICLQWSIVKWILVSVSSYTLHDPLGVTGTAQYSANRSDVISSQNKTIDAK
jgi:hypothetical protein